MQSIKKKQRKTKPTKPRQKERNKETNKQKKENRHPQQPTIQPTNEANTNWQHCSQHHLQHLCHTTGRMTSRAEMTDWSSAQKDRAVGRPEQLSAGTSHRVWGCWWSGGGRGGGGSVRGQSQDKMPPTLPWPDFFPSPFHFWVSDAPLTNILDPHRSLRKLTESSSGDYWSQHATISQGQICLDNCTWYTNWDTSRRSNLLSRPVTVCWHRDNKS